MEKIRANIKRRYKSLTTGKSVGQRLKDVDWRQTALDYFMILLGSGLSAMAVVVFYTPNRVMSGGLTGLAIIIHYWLGAPVGMVYLLESTPLFFASMYLIGGFSGGLRTIFSMIVYSFAIDLLTPFAPTITHDPLLYTIFGGAIEGVGVGLILRARATTCGTDTIGQLLRRFTGLPISQGILLADGFVLVIAALFFGPERALYSLVIAFTASRTIDFLLTDGRSARQILIISSKWQELKDAIIETLERGVTVMDTKGAYTEENRTMLLTIVGRNELTAIRRLIQQIDPEAFVTISQATEVWGEGFSSVHDDLG
jgi:uncharacterized membrane-anchored protein YitT (DUF2179 family)